MSEIKIKEEPIYSKVIGTYPDVDENNSAFTRLSFSLKHPITKEEIYYQLNKEDSKNLLIEKEDGLYVEEDNVNYLIDGHCVAEYLEALSLAWKPGEEAVDIPSEWWDEVKIVPKDTAMWDEVYVDKEIVKIDYSVGCKSTLLNKLNDLISLVREKFPNDSGFKNNKNNIIGMYLDNHSIRPPYKSNNTITVYHMYYKKDWFQELLKEYKVPEQGYKYYFWFGFKYDLDSKKRYLKVVIEDNDTTSNYQANPDSFIPRPQLPHCNEPYFAKIYNPDGTEADEYDVFFSTTPKIMKAYCEENELSFPFPEDKEDEYIWTYGLVYDKKTLKIKQVKGYIKKAQEVTPWLI